MKSLQEIVSCTTYNLYILQMWEFVGVVSISRTSNPKINLLDLDGPRIKYFELL